MCLLQLCCIYIFFLLLEQQQRYFCFFAPVSPLYPLQPPPPSLTSFRLPCFVVFVFVIDCLDRRKRNQKREVKMHLNMMSSMSNNSNSNSNSSSNSSSRNSINPYWTNALLGSILTSLFCRADKLQSQTKLFSNITNLQQTKSKKKNRIQPSINKKDYKKEGE